MAIGANVAIRAAEPEAAASGELSGRALEIAVCKALGLTVRAWVDGSHDEGGVPMWYLFAPDGSQVPNAWVFRPKGFLGGADTEEEAWEQLAPRYLTDPAAA